MEKIIICIFLMASVWSQPKHCESDYIKHAGDPVFNGETAVRAWGFSSDGNKLNFLTLLKDQSLNFYRREDLKGVPELILENGILARGMQRCALHEDFLAKKKSLPLCEYSTIQPSCNFLNKKHSGIRYFFEKRYPGNIFSFRFGDQVVFSKIDPSKIEVLYVGENSSGSYYTNHLTKIKDLTEEAEKCIKAKDEKCLSKIIEHDIRYTRIRDGIYEKAANETVNRLIPRNKCKEGLKYVPEEPLDFASRDDYKSYVKYLKEGVIENDHLTFWLFYNKNSHLGMNNLFDYYKACLNSKIENKKISVVDGVFSYHINSVRNVSVFMNDSSRRYHHLYREPLYFDKNSHACVKKLNFYDEIPTPRHISAYANEDKGISWHEAYKPISYNFLSFKAYAPVRCYLRVRDNGKLQVWLSDESNMIAEIYKRIPGSNVFGP